MKAKIIRFFNREYPERTINRVFQTVLVFLIGLTFIGGLFGYYQQFYLTIICLILLILTSE